MVGVSGAVSIDRSPTRVSGALAVIAGLVAVITLALSGRVSLPGIVGLVLVAVGVYRGSRRVLGVGVAVLFVGVLLAGMFATAPELLVIATAAVVLAWDIGENAITVGERFGRRAETTGAETVHAAVSTIVAVVAGTTGYLVYRSATGGQPTAALVALLFAVVALVVVLRR